MKKNNYIQPLSEAVELNPMQVLCVSDIPVDNEQHNGQQGDAPKRRLF